MKVITPEPRRDERGWFLRVFDAASYAAAGIDHTRLVQENQSRSKRRTIRGLHGRCALSEAKLIRCVRGSLFDVVVDLRPWSPTFLQWESFDLDDDTHTQIYVPAGFAHGFQALAEPTDIGYRVDSPYDPALDVAVAFDDPDLAIPWPLDDPIVSERDRDAPRLSDIRDQLTNWYGTDAPA
ncbi:MAG TPA: dTDP-4-dehydrorhamnose 3,5-epimerase family protein [Acidimicrobiia bacterium]|nr:dTDP-4-dehydrorhamnose 3,5-epimerase family protein [Acidimicrobiia bacterium]